MSYYSFKSQEMQQIESRAAARRSLSIKAEQKKKDRLSVSNESYAIALRHFWMFKNDLRTEWIIEHPETGEYGLVNEVFRVGQNDADLYDVQAQFDRGSFQQPDKEMLQRLPGDYALLREVPVLSHEDQKKANAERWQDNWKNKKLAHENSSTKGSSSDPQMLSILSDYFIQKYDNNSVFNANGSYQIGSEKGEFTAYIPIENPADSGGLVKQIKKDIQRQLQSSLGQDFYIDGYQEGECSNDGDSWLCPVTIAYEAA